MKKIAINAGHYRYTEGKRCMKSIDPSETREWVLNDRVVRHMADQLAQYDCQLIRCDDPTGETSTAIQKRCDTANNAGADIYLSVHHNAGINGGAGGGTVVYTHPNADAQTKALQRLVYESMIATAGLKGNRSQPLATANFEELRKAKMSALLIECGFMDSTVDVPFILQDANSRLFAAGIVNAVVEYFDISLKNAPEPAPVPQEPTPSPSVGLSVGDTVTYSGRLYGDSNGGNAGLSVNGTYTVSRVLEGRSHGVLLNGDLGWVRAVDCVKQGATAPEPPNPALKPIDEIAREVINGEWGNGQARKDKLAAAGYDAVAVQKRVNELLK